MNLSTTTILNTINQSRMQQNLPPLKFNATLAQFAQNKADDMVNKNYFSHISPEGKTFKNFIDTNKYNYNYAGENLAVHYNDPAVLEKSWMDSPTHRANILSPNYRDIGIATHGEFAVTFFGNTPQSVPQPIKTPPQKLPQISQKPLQKTQNPTPQFMPRVGNFNSTIPIAPQNTQKVNNMLKLR